MAYYLKSNERLDIGVKRIADEQLGKALAAVEHKKSVHAAVHDIRKRCKKLRALLRLVRDDLGKTAYKERNIYFRDEARKLSYIRDIKVQIQSMQKLRDRHGEDIPTEFFTQVEDYFIKERSRLEEEVIQEEGRVEAVLARLRKARTQITEWPVSETRSFAAIRNSLKRVYKRGYKRFPEAFGAGNPELFHEFRKRGKYLWYHLRLLKKSWPPLFKKLNQEVHRLTNLLGDDHDLMVLRSTLRDIPFTRKRILHDVEKHLQQESVAYRQEAYGLAQRIYAEKPKRFVKRIGTYWTIWQDER